MSSRTSGSFVPSSPVPTASLVAWTVRCALFLGSIALTALSCSRHTQAIQVAPTDASLAPLASPAPSPAPSETPPVEAGPAPIAGVFETQTVPGHPDALVSLPTGATTRRPVLVVVHGSGDRPNWQCEGWRSATVAFPFIVCPTGMYDARWSTPGDTRYTHTGGAPLLEYIDASLAALAARYPREADTQTPLLAGFSLGASEVLGLAVKAPARFPRIAFIEGAWDGWTDARVAAYVSGGGQRVLYGAGQRDVERRDRATAKRLVDAGLDTRVVFAPAGHSFDQRLVDAIRAEAAWLVEGDARWGLMGH
jgi:poly(3-hydroxybutyrate) depolymerase